jgi:D-alanyl-D-alanine carboxypeptidase/D-alanyl-D-alanine-endopeptidase (penicillin-binding protein 4)
MRKIEIHLLLLLSVLLSPVMGHAQTVDDDVAEAADTLQTDSLWADSLQNEASLKADSLPWPQNIQAGLADLVKSDMFQTSQLGMMIWDLDADSVLFKVGERQTLRPASTLKTITAIVALDRLGGSYQFKTDLCYTGRVDSCTLRGDVYCVGGFDPRFNSDDLRAFVEALKRMGVDTIRGNLYADKSMKDDDLLGEGWCWDDDNPVLSPLLIGRKDEFMSHFYDQLRREGIVLMGAIGNKRKPQDANCIVSRFHTIDQILMRMLKQSDNLYAESMFYQIAASTGNRPATAKNARSVINQLVSKVGLDPDRYEFADGSGLSLYNYVSAELEVRLLRYAFQNENIYHHLLPALPIAGQDGTLRERMRQTFTRGNVHAKTGTVTGISSLCGYLTAYNGHRLCFAIINQGIMHNKNGHRFQDQVCALLCRPH